MWTPQRLETLRTLWTEGHSASEIAQHLGGVTRNAVIGVVHRRGWKKRIDPNSNSTGRTERVRQKRKARRVAAPRLNPAPKIKLPADLAAARAIPMSDVLLCDAAPSMCKFMAGDPAHDPRVCGRATMRGRVYCADHVALCYVPADPKKKPRVRT
jgi:GcrA cell cycle regulator